MGHNKGLLEQVLLEFLSSIKAESRISEDVISALTMLAAQGKLKDISALQAAIRAMPPVKSYENS
jgi:hypothetical protein